MGEQRSDKHSFRLDDAIKDGVADEVRAGHPVRATEWREAETPGEDQPEIGLAPNAPLPGGVPAGMSPHDVDLRSRIAQHIPQAIYPADREAILAALRRVNAPDALRDQLARLPAGRSYHNLREIAESLGIGVERHRS